MAQAKKCDRCGKLFEIYGTKNNVNDINGVLTVNIDEQQLFYKQDLMDFCPTCRDSFLDWLKKGKEEDD